MSQKRHLRRVWSGLASVEREYATFRTRSWTHKTAKTLKLSNFSPNRRCSHFSLTH